MASDKRSLPGLAADLAGGLLDLIQANVQLLGAEARQTAGTVGRRAIWVLPALAIAGSGVLLALAGLGLWIGDLLGKPYLGLLALGVLALFGGGLWAWAAMRSVAAVDLTLPISRAEIDQDVAWLKNRMKEVEEEQ